MIVTTFSVSGFCPCIQENVTLTGKYEVVDDQTYKFLSFKCPIEENAKLPYYDQAEKNKYLKPCDNVIECPIALRFQKEIFL